MENSLLVPESKAVIRFQDCDPYNHLNNASYINYFINAREDQLLAAYDFNIYRYAKEKKLTWLVGQNQIAYLQPANVMEVVIIQTAILKFAESEILVEMLMWDSNKERLKALLWSTFIHFNFLTNKREQHSEELINLFKRYENPLDPSIKTFEDRVAGIKGKKI